ncbi:expressed unknown protein [Seminavis robusta]|uniref:Uncharacterized protein n=1 Tax=Seminavis robusta TaxID=568900 RepID=A0A9N8DTC6_9STRA|nr:expressed unknown protein [Seminavis robusta]|eukprot:Sro342_g121720.1 n/a (178) ;mRNA; f:33375-33908
MCQEKNNTLNRAIQMDSTTMRKTNGILKIQTQEDSLAATSPVRKQSRHVSFGDTQIHTFPRILDTIREGPALTIGWEPVSSKVLTFQEFYLVYRSINGKPRPLIADDRIVILLDAGCEKEELLQHFLPASVKEQQQQQQQQQQQEQSKPPPSKTMYGKVRKAALKLTGIKNVKVSRN